MSYVNSGVGWFSGMKSSTKNFLTEITIDEVRTTLTWSGPSYILGINMLEVHQNGVLLNTTQYTEISGNSIQILTTVSLGDIFHIRYIPGSVSLGDIKIADDLIYLQSLTNIIPGTIGITTNNKKFWIMTNTGWSEFVVPLITQNIGLLFDYEKQNITGDSTYTLEKLQYNINMGNISIFIDGKYISPDNYTEVDATTIVFDQSPLGNEIVFMTYSTDSFKESINNITTYEYNVNNQLFREKTIDELERVIEECHYLYTDTGNILRKITIRGIKTIRKDYLYDNNDRLLSCETVVY